MEKDVRFGTWNVTSLYRAGSLTAAVRDLARNKLDLVGVQDVRWGTECMVRVGDYVYLWKRKPKVINREQDFLRTTELYKQLRE
jgi:hypothetical protein